MFSTGDKLLESSTAATTTTTSINNNNTTIPSPSSAFVLVTIVLLLVSSCWCAVLITSKKMHWYYNFLVRRPYLMVLSIAVLCLACIIVSLTTSSLPDFSDPTLGFEARGTNIGKRLTAWHNLIQETGPSGTLVADPNDLRHPQDELDEAGVDIDYSALSRRRKLRRNRKRKNKRRQKKLEKEKENAELLAKSSGSSIITSTSDSMKMWSSSFQNRVQGVVVTQDNNDNDQVADRRSSTAEWNTLNGIFRDYEVVTGSSHNDSSWSSAEQQQQQLNQLNRSEHFEYGRNTTSVDEEHHRERIQTKKSTWRILKQAAVPPLWAAAAGEHLPPIDGYFCDSPAKEYSHFVIERIGPNATASLFDLNGLLAMCQLQDQITGVADYGEYCQKEMLVDNCCRPWSLSNYAALLANKSSCFDLTTEDVAQLQNLLVVCFEYFHDLKLSNDCSEYNRCYAPTECMRNNVVYNILHFLTDYNFIKINDSNVYLKYAMIFVPVAHTTKILPLFHEWSKVDLKTELVQVIAMDLGLENELFNECLLTDGWLVALGGLFVMACMYLYTSSLFVTAMTCLAVLFSLGLAYFVYTLVFEMTFFPYMNLLAVVVMIGIGADDSFIFIKIWQCVLAERFAKSSTPVATHSLSNSLEAEHTETLQNLMALTLRHSAVSMCVTSLTTAGAFYASYTSSITAIKCFGVFAGTAVITNYMLMVTWLPASVSIMERISSCNACSKLQVQKILLMLNKSITKICHIFEMAVIAAVRKYAAFWIFVFATIGVSSMIIVLYWPGLQLPENSHFQLFVTKHPFEVYNAKMKNEFWFEKTMTTFENFKMPLRFVWGIQPVDDGDYASPFARGNLYYDNNFNISTKAAQVWLFEFCQHLKRQPFYQLTFGMLLPNCFIENFISLMDRTCIEGMDGTDRTPCCDISKFPFEPHIFEICLPQIISSLYTTPREYFIPGVAGPKFAAPTTSSASSTTDADFVAASTEEDLLELNASSAQPTTAHKAAPPPITKALIIEFESNMSYTTVYRDVKSFVHTVEQWFAQELSTAPAEMRNGWFISDLKFFDVQDTLAHDTLVAIAVAMCASLVVLVLVTLNVLVSLYAVLTVTFTIFTTVAILIMLGWQLNVLESVTVSTAIGLAVDFSLHYGIHYRLSPTCERLAATQFALTRIIGPTAMAAITTGLAGGLMLFSNVLPYIQIGVFLVVVMSVSWLYATFFLMSLLKLAGPQYGFMQFNYSGLNKRPAANGIKYYERKQSQVIASEQLLTPSSSAVGELINSETHELESLTSNSLIKTISGMECGGGGGGGGTHHAHSSSFPLDFEHSFQTAPSNAKQAAVVSISLNNYQSPSTTKSATVELPASVSISSASTTTDAADANNKFYKT